MHMSLDDLVGVAVRITIDRAESGDQSPLNVIHGTIRGSVRSGNGILYHVVSLHEEVDPLDKNPSVCGARDAEESLLVAPKYAGDSLSDAFREKMGSVLVGIARVGDTSMLGEDTLDWSKVDYFAVGELRFISMPKDEGR